jgi:hypothetical protein
MLGRCVLPTCLAIFLALGSLAALPPASAHTSRTAAPAPTLERIDEGSAAPAPGALPEADSAFSIAGLSPNDVDFYFDPPPGSCRETPAWVWSWSPEPQGELNGSPAVFEYDWVGGLVANTSYRVAFAPSNGTSCLPGDTPLTLEFHTPSLPALRATVEGSTEVLLNWTNPVLPFVDGEFQCRSAVDELNGSDPGPVIQRWTDTTPNGSALLAGLEPGVRYTFAVAFTIGIPYPNSTSPVENLMTPGATATTPTVPFALDVTTTEIDVLGGITSVAMVVGVSAVAVWWNLRRPPNSAASSRPR